MRQNMVRDSCILRTFGTSEPSSTPRQTFQCMDSAAPGQGYYILPPVLSSTQEIPVPSELLGFLRARLDFFDDVLLQQDMINVAHHSHPPPVTRWNATIAFIIQLV